MMAMGAEAVAVFSVDRFSIRMLRGGKGAEFRKKKKRKKEKTTSGTHMIKVMYKAR